MSGFGYGSFFSMPNTLSMRLPWLSKAEPSSHCQARGRGASAFAGSKAAPPPALTASYSAASFGSSAAQFSSACCSVSAAFTGAARFRSRETTLSRPSGVPFGRVANFIGVSLRRSLADGCPKGSVLEDRDRAAPASGGALDLHGEARDGEAGRRQRFEVG